MMWQLSITLIVLSTQLRPGESDVQCGLRPGMGRSMDSLIVGGKEAARHSWPWQVHIVNHHDGNSECGGTIIDKRWILTAGHCISKRSPSFYTVLAGVHNTSKKVERGRVKVAISKIKRNPGFTGKDARNDLALLRTSEDLVFSRTVAPACLPTKPVQEGTMCAITGFGFTNNNSSRRTSATLQEVYLPIIKRELCAKWMYYTIIDESMLCAAVPEGGKDSCGGDSGGPLVCKNGNKWELQGVVSMGTSFCGLEKGSGIYAKVTHYLDWIDSVMKKSGK